MTSKELEELFLSVEWSSGHYPDKLETAMRNYQTVFTAWDGDKLVGLISAMDDGIMTAYIHYLLVRPEYQGNGIGLKLIEKTKEKYSINRFFCLFYTNKCRFVYVLYTFPQLSVQNCIFSLNLATKMPDTFRFIMFIFAANIHFLLLRWHFLL